jgi:DNA-binding NarL/FixJ family response regulator
MAGRLSGVLLIAQPGRMRASLRVLLRSLYPLIQIDQTDDVSSVKMLLAADRPLLVLIDADLPDDEGWRIGDEIKQMGSQHTSILLAHHSSQADRARMAGVDVIFLEGMTATSLSDAIGVFGKVEIQGERN